MAVELANITISTYAVGGKFFMRVLHLPTGIQVEGHGERYTELRDKLLLVLEKRVAQAQGSS